ncbi:3-keto-disaccharide hydrolase [Pelagicoccus mobilis]|uniref:DUF1080 domain-containing protein n=1 Tax=Pelagicoccus mobilis TaxID=415221 RepID=A0A934S023_9BACT|nr:DUF1080 domain-containing protein [Pelagicoccus mobilis]MBK1879448.1 DUF1080 domain-containing protein [Pelagicoccus mobilis]
MKNKLPALILLPCLAFISFPAFAEWEHIFKGIDLEEFYFDFIEEAEPADVFEIKDDGTLVIKGEDQPEGYIQTLDEYENFELSFAFKFPEGEGKSGVIIHCNGDTAHGIWPEGIEIQLEPKNNGDFWLLNNEIDVEENQMPNKAAERNRRLRIPQKKTTYTTQHLKKERERPPEQWNDMRIVAKEDTIQVFLNGELVNDGKNASASAGFISVQAEESNIEIKDFRIRELDTE